MNRRARVSLRKVHNMNMKTKEQNAEASRISKLKSAYRKHQPAIQAALKARELAKQANMPVKVAVDPDGIQYRIGCYGGSYRVLGVEQSRRLA